MKIRIFSDIHVDYNERFPFSFRGKDKDIFTLIPGDVSGNVKTTANWIQHNIHNGMFISGNHDPSYNEIGWTIKRQKQYLAEKFPIGGGVTFLDESVGVMSKQIPDTNILVVGSTLYTDYKYANDCVESSLKGRNELHANAGEPPMGIEDFNMMQAAYGLNDFRWGHVEDESDDRGLKQRYVRPSDYRKWFDVTFRKIEQLVQENKDKDIIVMTHHCPTPKCISSTYVDNKMNASYVSDLEGFITSHPNIRAWCCGHVHNTTLGTVGDSGQLLVCNPRGYESHMEALHWNPNTFIDTDTWTISSEPYSPSQRLEKARDNAARQLERMALFFL